METSKLCFSVFNICHPWELKLERQAGTVTSWAKIATPWDKTAMEQRAIACKSYPAPLDSTNAHILKGLEAPETETVNAHVFGGTKVKRRRAMEVVSPCGVCHRSGRMVSILPPWPKIAPETAMAMTLDNISSPWPEVTWTANISSSGTQSHHRVVFTRSVIRQPRTHPEAAGRLQNWRGKKCLSTFLLEGALGTDTSRLVAYLHNVVPILFRYLFR